MSVAEGFIVDFNKHPKNNKYYAGDAGQKLGIDIGSERWLLKFPKTTKGLKSPQVSYTSSPLSEYLGSKIYAALRVPVHETMLGVRDGRLVVACKDFERQGLRFTDFKSIKNSYLPSMGDDVTSGSGTDLSEILRVIELSEAGKAAGDIEQRFWDMFVIDFIIHNNDRNNTNWGILQDADYRHIGLAPVFDNGNAFSNKRADTTFEHRINDPALIRQDAYEVFTNAYLDEKGHHIKPAEFLRNTGDGAAIEAVSRIVGRWDKDVVQAIFDEVPVEFNGIKVMSEARREYYLRMMDLSVSEVLAPIHDKQKGNKGVADCRQMSLEDKGAQAEAASRNQATGKGPQQRAAR
ncbi:MAG: HipA domain-containing protein [Actinomycetia bacterium]|nr:HipA domain-containing protein [Actinomycetes bacterium]